MIHGISTLLSRLRLIGAVPFTGLARYCTRYIQTVPGTLYEYMVHGTWHPVHGSSLRVHGTLCAVSG
jgi:hypothetical protein